MGAMIVFPRAAPRKTRLRIDTTISCVNSGGIPHSTTRCIVRNVGALKTK